VTSHTYASDKVVWIEAEGTAYQNEMETPKEVKEKAIRDAQTKEVESAEGTFIRSHTLISNSQIAEERIKIIATKQKEELLSLEVRDGLFQAYDVKFAGMISDLIKRLNQIEPSDWTEGKSVYIVRK
jgi:arginine/ornithine N-succinyltransferase beta subunit